MERTVITIVFVFVSLFAPMREDNYQNKAKTSNQEELTHSDSGHVNPENMKVSDYPK